MSNDELNRFLNDDLGPEAQALLAELPEEKRAGFLRLLLKTMAGEVDERDIADFRATVGNEDFTRFLRIAEGSVTSIQSQSIKMQGGANWSVETTAANSSTQPK